MMSEVLFNLTQELNTEAPWLLPLAFFLFGACVGSFLNVVIYRLPLGMSVNEPSRSFCPHCHKPIPFWLNIPVLSWLMLRGRSTCCGQRIAPRYALVELGTALLFLAVALRFRGEDILTQALLCTWIAAMLASFFIDWEKMMVLLRLCLTAAAAAFAAAAFSPWLLTGESLEASAGLLASAGGAAAGFLLFRTVALLGRLFLGQKQEVFAQPRPWRLCQSADGKDIELALGEEKLLWSELFMEEANRLCLRGATLHGQQEAEGELIFSAENVRLADGRLLPLEDFEELGGSCGGVAARREAMGSGDAWLALAIGAMGGWQGVLFSLCAGSILGLLYAALARIGRGKPIPFGPALIAAALLWLFFRLQLEEGLECWSSFIQELLG